MKIKSNIKRFLAYLKWIEEQRIELAVKAGNGLNLF